MTDLVRKYQLLAEGHAAKIASGEVESGIPADHSLLSPLDRERFDSGLSKEAPNSEEGSAKLFSNEIVPDLAATAEEQRAGTDFKTEAFDNLDLDIV
jgi:hypothetical protein